MYRLSIVLFIVLTAPASAQGLPYWTKEAFESPDGKAYLREYEDWLDSDWSDRGECEAYLRDFEQILDEAIAAGGNISVRYDASWRFCAARFFPADTPEECRASRAALEKLSAADPRFRRSKLSSYLDSFCG